MGFLSGLTALTAGAAQQGNALFDDQRKQQMDADKYTQTLVDRAAIVSQKQQDKAAKISASEQSLLGQGIDPDKAYWLARDDSFQKLEPDQKQDYVSRMVPVPGQFSAAQTQTQQILKPASSVRTGFLTPNVTTPEVSVPVGENQPPRQIYTTQKPDILRDSVKKLVADPSRFQTEAGVDTARQQQAAQLVQEGKTLEAMSLIGPEYKEKEDSWDKLAPHIIQSVYAHPEDWQPGTYEKSLQQALATRGRTIDTSGVIRKDPNSKTPNEYGGAVTIATTEDIDGPGYHIPKGTTLGAQPAKDGSGYHTTMTDKNGKTINVTIPLAAAGTYAATANDFKDGHAGQAKMDRQIAMLDAADTMLDGMVKDVASGKTPTGVARTGKGFIQSAIDQADSVFKMAGVSGSAKDVIDAKDMGGFNALVNKVASYNPGIKKSEVQKGLLSLMLANATQEDGRVSTTELNRWTHALDFSGGPQDTVTKLNEVRAELAMQRQNLKDSRAGQQRPSIARLPNDWTPDQTRTAIQSGVAASDLERFAEGVQKYGWDQTMSLYKKTKGIK